MAWLTVRFAPRSPVDSDGILTAYRENNLYCRVTILLYRGRYREKRLEQAFVPVVKSKPRSFHEYGVVPSYR